MKNLIIRALTGIVYVAILVGGICCCPVTFLTIFSLIILLSLREFYGLIQTHTNTLSLWINCISGVYLFAATFTYMYGWTGSGILLPYILYILYIFIAELYSKADNPIQNWGYALLGQVYYGLPFALMNFIVFTPEQAGTRTYAPILLLAIFVFVWMNDTGAFLFGSMLGKHKLFERISPKKSWEGFYGGLVVALASSFVFYYFQPHIEWYKWVGLAVTVVIFGTWGDLTESLMKRTLHIKDSGSILPGHGGMLDRLDSLMLAIPASLIYIKWIIQN